VQFDLEYDDNDNEEFRTRLRRQFASNVFQQFTSFFSHNGLEQCPDFVQVSKGLWPWCRLIETKIQRSILCVNVVLA